MELIRVKDNLLLLDKTADIYYDSYFLLGGKFINCYRGSMPKRFKTHLSVRIIAHLPLTEKAFELKNVPLLPEWKRYEVAQPKKFTIDDMKNCFAAGRSFEIYQLAKNLDDFEEPAIKPMNDIDYIKSLSKLPIDFIPEFKKVLAPIEWFTNFLHHPDLAMFDKIFYDAEGVEYKIKNIEHDSVGNTKLITDIPHKSFVWNYQNNKTIFINSNEFKTTVNSNGEKVLVGEYKW